MAHKPRKKPLDFGDNPDHVTLGLGYGYGYSYVRHSTFFLVGLNSDICPTADEFLTTFIQQQEQKRQKHAVYRIAFCSYPHLAMTDTGPRSSRQTSSPFTGPYTP